MAERAELSRRQREVLEMLAAGLPAREIAARLGIAETTARNRIHALLQRLGCHSQLRAVAVGYERHLFDRSRVAGNDGRQPGETAVTRDETGP